MHRIAYFITPHGFGHAARASAIMDALNETVPSVSFDIFTTVPKWFFEDAFSGQFGYHEFVSDIGLVQKTPFSHDLKATIEALDRFIPFDSGSISDTADILNQRACRLVICDISPIGISIAKQAKIPCLLIENFTWDWIYEDFMQTDNRIRRYVDIYRKIYQAANYHIQAAPLCNPLSVDMTTHPISRKIGMPAARVREKLGISREKKMVLLTAGGVPGNYRFLENLAAAPEVSFVVPGGSESPEQHDNSILLPFRSGFVHSDLANAADAVVGKAGYSTIAEVYHAGVPFAYAPRSNFRETEKLVVFIEKEMTGICINDDDFQAGNWIGKVSHLLSLPRIKRLNQNGAHQVANFIAKLLKTNGK